MGVLSMAIYNIKVELSDYGVLKALEWDEGRQVSSSNYMDVKDALFEALKKEVDIEDILFQLDFPKKKINSLLYGQGVD